MPGEIYLFNNSFARKASIERKKRIKMQKRAKKRKAEILRRMYELENQDKIEWN